MHVLIGLKMVPVSENLYSIFLEKEWIRMIWSSCAPQANIFSENSRVELILFIWVYLFFSPPWRQVPLKSFIWGFPPPTFPDPKSSSPPIIKGGGRYVYIHT